MKESLKAACLPLEKDVSDSHKDWHPGSDDMVLDLVHPSLFPLIYGRSRILDNGIVGVDDCVQRCGEGKTISVSDNDIVFPRRCWPFAPTPCPWSFAPIPGIWSLKFQWLPCNVKFLEGSEEVKLVLLFKCLILVQSADS
jgi:hypothetical protein